MKIFNIPKINNKAFTLIELLVVISLIGVAVGVTSDILLSVTKSYNRTQINNELEQQANFITTRLNKDLRNSQEAVSSDDGKSLTLTIRDQSTTVSYTLDSSAGVLKSSLMEGTTMKYPSSPLTSGAGKEGVKISCDGTCFSVSTSTPRIVTYSFIIKSFYNENYLIKAKDTIVLRGTY